MHGKYSSLSSFILVIVLLDECNKVLLIWGSIGCALATKFGGEVGAHEISNTQKGLGRF